MHEPLEHPHPLVWRKVTQAHRAPDLHVARASSRSESRRGPRRPVDHRRRQTERTAVTGKRIQEGVRSRVVALPCRADQAEHRRVQHEEIEVEVARMAVQEPRAPYLGLGYARERPPLHLGHYAVAEHSGPMDDPTKRRQAAHPFHQAPDIRFYADVRPSDLDARTKLAQPLYHLQRRAARAPPSREHERPHALALDEQASGFEA